MNKLDEAWYTPHELLESGMFPQKSVRGITNLIHSKQLRAVNISSKGKRSTWRIRKDWALDYLANL